MISKSNMVFHILKMDIRQLAALKPTQQPDLIVEKKNQILSWSTCGPDSINHTNISNTQTVIFCARKIFCQQI